MRTLNELILKYKNMQNWHLIGPKNKLFLKYIISRYSYFVFKVRATRRACPSKSVYIINSQISRLPSGGGLALSAKNQRTKVVCGVFCPFLARRVSAFTDKYFLVIPTAACINQAWNIYANERWKRSTVLRAESRARRFIGLLIICTEWDQLCFYALLRHVSI